MVLLFSLFLRKKDEQNEIEKKKSDNLISRKEDEQNALENNRSIF